MKKYLLGFLTPVLLLASAFGYYWVEGERWVALPTESGACPFEDPGVLSRQELFQTEYWRVLFNYRQMTPGHCLLIPKRHMQSCHRLTTEEFTDFQVALTKTHALISGRLGTGPYLLLQKNGREAGQSVPHVHFHYIPRKEGENPFGLQLRAFFFEGTPPMTEEEQADWKQHLLSATNHVSKEL